MDEANSLNDTVTLAVYFEYYIKEKEKLREL